jgi:hypothetical protein
MHQMTAPQINKDRIQYPRSDHRDDAKERGPLKLLRAREDDSGDVRAELERILPSSFDRGEGSPMSSFDILYPVWIDQFGQPDQGKPVSSELHKWEERKVINDRKEYADD